MTHTEPTDFFGYQKLPPKGYITTFTGKQFYFESPIENDSICIEDIAHALSMICHFGGHTQQFFSVAQHSVLVAQAAALDGFDIPFQRWALLHDAAEAYLGDMTRPLKKLLPDYSILEKRVMAAIAHTFRLELLSAESQAHLKRLDDSILKLEARRFMNQAVLHDGLGHTYDLPEPPPGLKEAFIAPMSPFRAEAYFRSTFHDLFVIKP
jgi:5'-deoxynucleotidase YfbR-like HD superfamily hydrolase